MIFTAMKVAMLQTLHSPILLQVRFNVPEKRSKIIRVRVKLTRCPFLAVKAYSVNDSCESKVPPDLQRSLG